MGDNPTLGIAVDFVNNTSRHIFLTGRAGTGKTTFLKHIRENTPKKCVVVAPTGVAAINAGGVTMHSLFQLPLGPYLPSGNRSDGTGANDKSTLFRNLRLSGEKRDMLRELELVIIDEVSMVRCDTLDAMDAILRHVRKRFYEPFGGVQILYIGDLFQLPPVMPENEWNLLRQHYESPFFFDAKVVKQASPVYVELKHIYRQNEARFITLLNRVRNGDVNDNDFGILHGRYDAPLESDANYIILTTHNYRADRINQEALAKLPGEAREFRGTIEGDFPDKTLPTEIALQLKEGAQVMFIRNDKSTDHRYYNGKLAKVKTISSENIKVELADGGEELVVEKETWTNIRYSYDASAGQIEEEKLGSFTQYPIRLAWAITIHKSQGLTFEHAIIDAGDSFAPGQVYVALSRCTTLNGVVLRSRISSNSISTDPKVLAFTRSELEPEQLREVLTQEKRVFLNRSLLETFDFFRLREMIENFGDGLSEKKLPEPEQAFTILGRMQAGIDETCRVGAKFQDQLRELLNADSYDALRDRVTRAIAYFTGALRKDILAPLDEHIGFITGQRRVKKYLKTLHAMRRKVASTITRVQHARYGDKPFLDRPETVTDLPEYRGKTRPAKGESIRESLKLFKAGLKAPEIAKQRNLTVGTIESHLASLVRTGDINIHDVVDGDKLQIILDTVKADHPSSITEVKRSLGKNVSFGEIRAVLNHLSALESAKP